MISKSSILVLLHHFLDLVADLLEHLLGLLVLHESLEVRLVEVEFLLEVHDDVLELELHVSPVVAFEVGVVAVPDGPAKLSSVILFFFVRLVVQDFHVDVCVHDVILVDEVLDVDKNLRKLITMFFHEVDELDESSFAVESCSALVLSGSIPDFPAGFGLLFWLLWSFKVKIVLAIENFHVDISGNHVVLVNEVLDVDQEGRNVSLVLLEKIEEVLEVHLASFGRRRSGLVMVLGAFGSFVMRRFGLFFVEVDVDVGDEVLLKIDVGFDVILNWSEYAVAAHFELLHHLLDHHELLHHYLHLLLVAHELFWQFKVPFRRSLHPFRRSHRGVHRGVRWGIMDDWGARFRRARSSVSGFWTSRSLESCSESASNEEGSQKFHF